MTGMILSFQQMTNILLTVIALLLALALGGAVALFFRLRRVLVGFITPAKEGEPSPMAAIVDSASSMVARAIVAQAKTTLMGMQSGAVRAEQAVMADVAEAAVGDRFPAVGALLGSFPALRKSLRRNPALLDFALSKLAGAASKGGGNGNAPQDGGQVRFKL